jgi:hypothetical protein
MADTVMGMAITLVAAVAVIITDGSEDATAAGGNR